jgi:hypothetical protein
MPRETNSLFRDKYSKLNERIMYGITIGAILIGGTIGYIFWRSERKHNPAPSQIERITTEPARAVEER